MKGQTIKKNIIDESGERTSINVIIPTKEKKTKLDLHVNAPITDCNNSYNSVPIFVNPSEAAVIFMKNCERDILGIDQAPLPNLRVTKDTYDYILNKSANLLGGEKESKKIKGAKVVKSAKKSIPIEENIPIQDNQEIEGDQKQMVTEDDITRVIKGYKSPLSIVRARKGAYSTLVRSLFTNSITVSDTDNKFSLVEGIYNINNKIYIKTDIPIQEENSTFDVCELGRVFMDSKEDDIEEMDGGALLTRESLNDKNLNVMLADKAVLNIIILILYFSKSTNVELRNKAISILHNFMVASSAKEYLDVGQLYAIVQPTVDKNIENGWSHENIMININKILNSINSGTINEINIPTEMPIKPILETIDGAATRIASNQYLTSYCNFTLTNPTDDSSTENTFYIDTIDVFYLSFLLSKDEDIVKSLSIYIEREMNSNLQKMKELKYIYMYFRSIQYYNSMDNSTKIKAIHLLYKILIDDEIYSKLKKFVNDERHELTLGCVLIEKNIYFCSGLASFLYRRQKLQQNIQSGLIDCNFDPLCHDNAHSKFYRLVMIIMFLLKNNTEVIKQNLDEMFKEIKNQTTPIERTTLITDEMYDLLSRTMNTQELNIFNILANYGADKIESGLYVRLRKKSSYIFPVEGANKQYFGVVSFVDSAHYAVQPTLSELERHVEGQNVIPGSENLILSTSSLHAGIIIPHCVNCAIDAPLKHSFSLSNDKLNPNTKSKVIVTAVTRVDAANQKTDYSTFYTNPICIPINITNTNGPLKPGVSFIYQYMFGESKKQVEDKINSIPCYFPPGSIYCSKFKNGLKEFYETKFYFGITGGLEMKGSTSPLLEELLNTIAYNETVKNKNDRDKMRDIFSKLIRKGILGNAKGKITSLELYNAKEEFISFFIEYISNVQNDISSKEFLVNMLIILLDITNTKTTKYESLEDLQNRLHKFRVPMSSSTASASGYGGALVLNSRYSKPVFKSKSSSQNMKYNMNDLYGKNSKNDVNLRPEMTVNVLAKGSQANDQIPLTYSSVFGKYGFDMRINEEGEYELIILNTENDYKNYLERYGLQDTSRQPIEQVNQIRGGINMNRRKVRKTKKIHRNNKTKNSKIVKKHKSSKNINKRKTRKQ